MSDAVVGTACFKVSETLVTSKKFGSEFNSESLCLFHHDELIK